MIEYKRTYSELILIGNFGDRLKYLMVAGESYQSPRSISESFYKSWVWKQVRSDIIKRDLGCDLGCINQDIDGIILVHHINPITQEDIDNNSPKLYDPENLITVSLHTHNIIHYGPKKSVEIIERKPGDTQLWRRI